MLLRKELAVINGSSESEASEDRRKEISKAIEKADHFIKENKALGLKCIPDIWQMLEDISKEKTQHPPEDILSVSPRLYQTFNNL